VDPLSTAGATSSFLRGGSADGVRGGGMRHESNAGAGATWAPSTLRKAARRPIVSPVCEQFGPPIIAVCRLSPHLLENFRTRKLRNVPTDKDRLIHLRTGPTPPTSSSWPASPRLVYPLGRPRRHLLRTGRRRMVHARAPLGLSIPAVRFVFPSGDPASSASSSPPVLLPHSRLLRFL
jgi:hypothetical protein